MSLLFGEAVSQLDATLVLWLTVFMVAVSIILLFIPAHYGKFEGKGGWLPTDKIKIDGRIGFCIQELPSAIVPLLTFAHYWKQVDSTALLFLVLFEVHYIQR